jgi:serine/threonine protein kinase
MSGLHVQLGDYGEIIMANGQTAEGRIVGASDDAIVLQGSGGPEFPVRFADIYVVSRDESRSRPLVESAVIRGGDDARPVEMLELLGAGAQGRVHRARYTDSPPDEFVVVKEIAFPDREAARADDVEAKSRDIMNLRHEHLVQYLEVRRPAPGRVWVIMPYYKERDMVHFLSNMGSRTLSEYEICSLTLQLASALHFMHSARPPRVHRDVKLDNVLMFDGGKRTMLVDLDLSRALPEDRRSTVTKCGTYEYMAPEAEAGRIGPEADVWALGIILFILLAMPDFLLIPHPRTGEQAPFNSHIWTQDQLWDTVRRYVAHSCQKRRIQYNASLIELSCSMLNKDPRRRPTAADVMRHLEETMLQSLAQGTA